MHQHPLVVFYFWQGVIARIGRQTPQQIETVKEKRETWGQAEGAPQEEASCIPRKGKGANQQSQIRACSLACLMRSVRFASEVSDRQDTDISCLPGVYVHPGEFRPATSNVAGDGDAWPRYRNRYKRLQAYRCLPKAERRKRRLEVFGFSDGHRRFRRRRRARRNSHNIPDNYLPLSRIRPNYGSCGLSRTQVRHPEFF